MLRQVLRAGGRGLQLVVEGGPNHSGDQRHEKRLKCFGAHEAENGPMKDAQANFFVCNKDVLHDQQ